VGERERLDGWIAVGHPTTATGDVAGRLLAAAGVLSRVGEGITAGDRIITGSILQVPVRPTDDVVAEVAGLGTVQLSIAGRSWAPSRR
jgi:2-keto-4-pentenoate hydratase